MRPVKNPDSYFKISILSNLLPETIIFFLYFAVVVFVFVLDNLNELFLFSRNDEAVCFQITMTRTSEMEDLGFGKMISTTRLA